MSCHGASSSSMAASASTDLNASLDMDEDLKTELCCVVCTEMMNTPRSLPCGHSICDQCATNLIRLNTRRDHIECPVCRRVAAVPKDGLALNYGMRSIIEMLQKAQINEGPEKFNQPFKPPVPSDEPNQSSRKPSLESAADAAKQKDPRLKMFDEKHIEQIENEVRRLC